MSHKAVDPANVPAFEIVQDRVRAISPAVAIDRVGYDFDGMAYDFVLTGGRGREARLELAREFLDDLKDNPEGPNSRYTLQLTSRLNARVREAIEASGLISYGDEALKFMLLRYIVEEHKSGRPVHKWNAIGKDLRGGFELWLRTELSAEEKDALIWSWGELMRLRLIAPTGRDLVAPDDWAKATEKGLAAADGRSFTEYEEIEVFIGKGEVFTAFRSLQRIFQQAQAKIVIIDPYADETVLDDIADIHPGITVHLLTEHAKKSFHIAQAKLRQQRGNLEVRTVTNFHDRFVILDDAKCYQIGSSINHLGNKSTVIDLKSETVRDRVLAEFSKAWQKATPL